MKLLRHYTDSVIGGILPRPPRLGNVTISSISKLVASCISLSGRDLRVFCPRLLCVALQLVSSILLYKAFHKDPHGTNVTLDWKTARLYPIPSLIYLVHNNVQFFTLKCAPFPSPVRNRDLMSATCELMPTTCDVLLSTQEIGVKASYTCESLLLGHLCFIIGFTCRV
jgi:hypothetical protein